MGLINNAGGAEPEQKPQETQEQEPLQETGAFLRKWIIPAIIVLLIICALSGLAYGGYWVFVHKQELTEKFFPPEAEEPAAAVAPENPPEKESRSFFQKLIKRDRTITIKGTLLGEEGGAAVLINEKVIPEQTVINGMRIVEITNQSVVIQSGLRKYRLQVGESFNPDER